MTGVSFLYVTHPDAEAALTLGRALVEGTLAAAVNLLPPSQTVYRWKGLVESGSETVLIVKTRTALVDAVTAFIRQNHPYECPGIAAFAAIGGNPVYLQWIADSTASALSDQNSGIADGREEPTTSSPAK